MKIGTYFFALLFVVVTPGWGIGSGNHAGGHHDGIMDSHTGAPKEVVEMKNPVRADVDSIGAGKMLYGQFCTVCHGPEGLGNGPGAKGLATKPSNLVMMASQHSPGEFAWVIKKGRGDMPAWEEELEEKEVWNLVNYINSLGVETDGHAHKGDALPHTENHQH